MYERSNHLSLNAHTRPDTIKIVIRNILPEKMLNFTDNYLDKQRYYYEGYSIRELTGILKRKESTLQTQLAAGRRKLKEELKKAGEIPQNWEGEEK